jgi:hypothetical protein
MRTFLWFENEAFCNLVELLKKIEVVISLLVNKIANIVTSRICFQQLVQSLTIRAHKSTINQIIVKLNI